MGTITEKMSYLKETKQAIRTAIEEKGVSVADTDTFRSYASKIGTISVGGGGTKWFVGDFYNGQMYEGNNGDLFLNTGTTDQGTIFQFYDGMWSPVGNLMGPQGAQGLSGASEPVGSIILWGGDSVPANYLPCVGSAVSRTEYSDLFSVIGTHFGEGDGSTTFNLPDFSGLAPVGIDSSDINFNTVGKTYGEKTHTLTEWEMPSHNHKLNNGTKTPNGDGVDFGSTSGIAHMTYEEGEYYWSDTTYTGGSGAHNNIQPSIAMKFYIKAYQATATPARVVDSLDGNSTTDAPSVHAVNNKINSLVGDIDTWHEITELLSSFKLYDEAEPVQYRKVGNVVEVCGQLAPVSALPGSTSVEVMFILPEGYRPNKTRYFVCQGSDTNKWLLTIYANGYAGFSRYGTTEMIECTPDKWLPFNVMFTTDGEGINALSNSSSDSSNYESILTNTIQSPTTIKQEVIGNLSKSYSEFDLLFVRISVGSSSSGQSLLVPMSPNHLESRPYFSVSENYCGWLVLKLQNNNQIGLTVTQTVGWTNDNYYITAVYGAKIGQGTSISLSERNIATFRLDGDSYNLTNGVEATIPISASYNIGTKISLSSDGYIQVSDDVSHVLISGMVDISVDVDGDYAARVDIDGDNGWLMTTGQCSTSSKAGRRIHVGFSPVIVETGMIKKFRPKVTLTGGNGTIQHGANGRCNFTVEVLKHL